MSKTLRVSKSGYYKWLKMNEKWQSSKAELQSKIKDEFVNSYQTYGSPRVAIELKKKGLSISKTTVARYMHSMSLKARDKKRFTVTTDSDHQFAVVDNLLNRNFAVEELNKVWVSDITVNDNFNYLTTVIDLADRMVVGWHLSDNMTAEDTTIAAFNKAIANRNIERNARLMFHSDRGVQYACHKFTNLLKQYNCVQSMSRKGNCWDNAVAESFFKTIKIEMIDKYKFQSYEVLKKFIFRYIDGWYNTLRVNSALDYKTPLETFNSKHKKIAA